MSPKLSKNIFKAALVLLVIHFVGVSFADLSEMANLGKISLITQISAFAGFISVPILAFNLTVFIETNLGRRITHPLQRIIAFTLIGISLAAILPATFNYAASLESLPLAQILQIGRLIKWSSAILSIGVMAGLIAMGINAADIVYLLTSRVRHIGTRVMILLMVAVFGIFLWLSFLGLKGQELIVWAIEHGHLEAYLVDKSIWKNVSGAFVGTIASGMSLLLPFILILAWRFGRKISEGLDELVNGFSRVAQGNLDVAVKVHGNDEVAQMQRGFNDMLIATREQRFLETAFGRYVSPHVLDRMRSDPNTTHFEGEKLVATVLFSDIRGFTSMSAGMPPEEVISMLNEYMTRMIDVIDRYDGYINKFVGDAIMVVWNTPVATHGHALLAAACAADMQKVLAKANANGAFDGHQIEMGIGINTGPLVAGNLGDKRQVEFTVIGDTVNVSSRACSAAGIRQVAITNETHKSAQAASQAAGIDIELGVTNLGEVDLKGKGLTQLLCLDEKLSLTDAQLAKLKANTRRKMSGENQRAEG
jgi:class 3 adenylate cyclase